jgi:hypothetical protein
MKHTKILIVLTLTMSLLLLVSCVPLPAATPTITPLQPTTAPPRLSISLLPTIWTPADWQQNGGKLRNWVRDGNGNFVDDLIETKPQDEFVSVTVDLNRCINEEADLSFLSQYGNIEYVGKYLSFVIMSEVRVDRAVNLAQRPEVAGVELNPSGGWTGDNFKAAKVENSNTYRNATLQGAFGWPTKVSGKGVNIVFLDSGVGPSYDSFFKHGYDATQDKEMNPDPDTTVDHATWMASWIWGSGNMAPDAGLIDIKVSCGSNSPTCYSTVMKALEKIHAKQLDWQINVVNMSFNIGGPSSDMDALTNLVNLLSDNGIVMVAAAGDIKMDAPGHYTQDQPVQLPAGAARAIAVSAADIHGAVDRNQHTATFVKGPWSGASTPVLSALKPEVTMPTGEGNTMVSSSIATAMTSGLVALILQQNPDLKDPANGTTGSVKDLLIRSAEPKGTPDTSVTYPRSTPTWDQYWGFGEVDAYEAFSQLTSNMRTDLTFIGFDGSAHPSQPWYFSRAVETESQRNNANPTVGKPDKVFARVYNNGSQVAHNVAVSFRFHNASTGIPKFEDIGTVIVPTIQVNKFVDVEIPWIPQQITPGEEHGCVLVTIDYDLDTNFAGKSNVAQRNLQVKSASSPAIFTFNLENPLPTTAQIDLQVTADPLSRIDLSTWRVDLQDVTVVSPGRCGRKIQVTITPPEGTPPGTEALFFVTAVASGRGFDKKEVGGVALKVVVP